MNPDPGCMIDASSSQEPKFRMPVPSGCALPTAASTEPDDAVDDVEPTDVAFFDAPLLWPNALPRPLPCAAAGGGASAAPATRTAIASLPDRRDAITADRPSS